jgi:uncharacterized protein (TIGR00266 family)
MRQNHEIDYCILGNEMQCVEIELDPQESVIAEPGSFMMMDNSIQMQTLFGDGSTKESGIMGKLFSAGKRLLTGENLFMTIYTNVGSGKRKVSFASPYPGKIIPLDLSEMGGKVICQKDSFLCAAKGVSVGIEFQRKLGTGLFGGEGFVHAGGHIVERTLGHGEMLKVDTGCIVAFSQSIDYDIQFVGGIKNTLFGGEGVFFATLSGPGKVWIQSLPVSRLASRIMQYGSFNRKEEGGILGGLGNLLDGDR